MKRPPLIDRRATSPTLAFYTGVSIVIGFVALAWASVGLPLEAGIAQRGMPAVLDGPVGGLVFWTGLGLLGSLRTTPYGGRAVVTFHLPFIVAAMTLGGPVAAAWVGVVSTLEVREFREVPWFGVLSNHATAALCGVVGGLVALAIRSSLAVVVDAQLATLGAALAGAFVFCTLGLGMNVVTIGLRERLTMSEALATFDRSFRHTIVAEVILGWLLALAYASVAWWAPVVCVVLVLVVWQANDEHEATTHDTMTGLLNRRGFEERLSVAVRRAHRGHRTGALLMVDLDGFKAINDSLGHAAGDDVLRAVGARLGEAIRLTDAAARLGGDEFAVLLERVPDIATAAEIARRIHVAVCEPLRLDAGDVSVGASFGVVFLDRTTSGASALDGADGAMYAIKERGGGVTVGVGP